MTILDSWMPYKNHNGDLGNHSKIIYENFVRPVWDQIWLLDMVAKKGQPGCIKKLK